MKRVTPSETGGTGQNGHTGAEFAAQLSAFLPVVMKQARLLSKGDRFTREDLTQEGVIAALGALDTYDPARGSLAAYIGTCARNRMISYLRRGMQESPMDAEKLDEQATEADVLTSTSATQERLEIREALSRLVEELSDFERVVLGAYLKGGSVAQTVNLLGCGRKRVDNALQRIRAKARNQ